MLDHRGRIVALLLALLGLAGCQQAAARDLHAQSLPSVTHSLSDDPVLRLRQTNVAGTITIDASGSAGALVSIVGPASVGDVSVKVGGSRSAAVVGLTVVIDHEVSVKRVSLQSLHCLRCNITLRGVDMTAADSAADEEGDRLSFVGGSRMLLQDSSIAVLDTRLRVPVSVRGSSSSGCASFTRRYDGISFGRLHLNHSAVRLDGISFLPPANGWPSSAKCRTTPIAAGAAIAVDATVELSSGSVFNFMAVNFGALGDLVGYALQFASDANTHSNVSFALGTAPVAHPISLSVQGANATVAVSTETAGVWPFASFTLSFLVAGGTLVFPPEIRLNRTAAVRTSLAMRAHETSRLAGAPAIRLVGVSCNVGSVALARVPGLRSIELANASADGSLSVSEMPALDTVSVTNSSLRSLTIDQQGLAISSVSVYDTILDGNLVVRSAAVSAEVSLHQLVIEGTVTLSALQFVEAGGALAVTGSRAGTGAEREFPMTLDRISGPGASECPARGDAPCWSMRLSGNTLVSPFLGISEERNGGTRTQLRGPALRFSRVGFENATALVSNTTIVKGPTPTPRNGGRLIPSAIGTGVQLDGTCSVSFSRIVFTDLRPETEYLHLLLDLDVDGEHADIRVEMNSTVPLLKSHVGVTHRSATPTFSVIHIAIDGGLPPGGGLIATVTAPNSTLRLPQRLTLSNAAATDARGSITIDTRGALATLEAIDLRNPNLASLSVLGAPTLSAVALSHGSIGSVQLGALPRLQHVASASLALSSLSLYDVPVLVAFTVQDSAVVSSVSLQLRDSRDVLQRLQLVNLTARTLSMTGPSSVADNAYMEIRGCVFKDMASVRTVSLENATLAVVNNTFRPTSRLSDRLTISAFDANAGSRIEVSDNVIHLPPAGKTTKSSTDRRPGGLVISHLDLSNHSALCVTRNRLHGASPSLANTALYSVRRVSAGIQISSVGIGYASRLTFTRNDIRGIALTVSEGIRLDATGVGGGSALVDLAPSWALDTSLAVDLSGTFHEVGVSQLPSAENVVLTLPAEGDVTGRFAPDVLALNESYAGSVTVRSRRRSADELKPQRVDLGLRRVELLPGLECTSVSVTDVTPLSDVVVHPNVTLRGTLSLTTVPRLCRVSLMPGSSFRSVSLYPSNDAAVCPSGLSPSVVIERVHVSHRVTLSNVNLSATAAAVASMPPALIAIRDSVILDSLSITNVDTSGRSSALAVVEVVGNDLGRHRSSPRTTGAQLTRIPRDTSGSAIGVSVFVVNNTIDLPEGYAKTQSSKTTVYYADAMVLSHVSAAGSGQALHVVGNLFNGGMLRFAPGKYERRGAYSRAVRVTGSAISDEAVFILAENLVNDTNFVRLRATAASYDIDVRLANGSCHLDWGADVIGQLDQERGAFDVTIVGSAESNDTVVFHSAIPPAQHAVLSMSGVTVQGTVSFVPSSIPHGAIRVSGGRDPVSLAGVHVPAGVAASSVSVSGFRGTAASHLDWVVVEAAVLYTVDVRACSNVSKAVVRPSSEFELRSISISSMDDLGSALVADCTAATVTVSSLAGVAQVLIANVSAERMGFTSIVLGPAAGDGLADSAVPSLRIHGCNVSLSQPYEGGDRLTISRVGAARDAVVAVTETVIAAPQSYSQLRYVSRVCRLTQSARSALRLDHLELGPLGKACLLRIKVTPLRGAVPTPSTTKSCSGAAPVFQGGYSISGTPVGQDTSATTVVVADTSCDQGPGGGPVDVDFDVAGGMHVITNSTLHGSVRLTDADGASLLAVTRNHFEATTPAASAILVDGVPTVTALLCNTAAAGESIPAQEACASSSPHARCAGFASSTSPDSCTVATSALAQCRQLPDPAAVMAHFEANASADGLNGIAAAPPPQHQRLSLPASPALPSPTVLVLAAGSGCQADAPNWPTTLATESKTQSFTGALATATLAGNVNEAETDSQSVSVTRGRGEPVQPPRTARSRSVLEAPPIPHRASQSRSAPVTTSASFPVRPSSTATASALANMTDPPLPPSPRVRNTTLGLSAATQEAAAAAATATVAAGTLAGPEAAADVQALLSLYMTPCASAAQKAQAEQASFAMAPLTLFIEEGPGGPLAGYAVAVAGVITLQIVVAAIQRQRWSAETESGSGDPTPWLRAVSFARIPALPLRLTTLFVPAISLFAWRAALDLSYGAPTTILGIAALSGLLALASAQASAGATAFAAGKLTQAEATHDDFLWLDYTPYWTHRGMSALARAVVLPSGHWVTTLRQKRWGIGYASLARHRDGETAAQADQSTLRHVLTPRANGISTLLLVAFGFASVIDLRPVLGDGACDAQYAALALLAGLRCALIVALRPFRSPVVSVLMAIVAAATAAAAGLQLEVVGEDVQQRVGAIVAAAMMLGTVNSGILIGVSACEKLWWRKACRALHSEADAGNAATQPLLQVPGTCGLTATAAGPPVTLPTTAPSRSSASSGPAQMSSLPPQKNPLRAAGRRDIEPEL